jgi:MFS family permease
MAIATEPNAVVEAHPAAVSRARTHMWFGLITVIYLFDIADRNVVAAALPAIQKEFALSDGAAGLLGSSLYLTLGLFVVPAGFLVDRWSRKYMIAIMSTLWSVATMATGLASSYASLLISRLFVGLGEAGYNPAGYALIAAWYPERLRGRMVGIFNTAQPIGTIIGIGIGGYIVHHFGWRYVFGLLAIPSLIVGLLILFAPDYRTKKVQQGFTREAKPVKATPLEVLRFIGSNKTLLLVFMAQLPLAFFIVALSVWAPTFFARQFGLDLADASKAVAIVVLAAAIGPIVGGWLSDRLSARQLHGRITATLLLLAVAFVFYTAGFLGKAYLGMGLGATLTVLAVAQFSFAGHWGSLVAAGLDLVPPHYRGTCQSFLPLCQALTGSWSAGAVGLLSDQMGLSVALQVAMVGGIAIASILLLLAVRTYASDHSRRKAMGAFALEPI